MEDVYRSGSWSGLQRAAGLPCSGQGHTKLESANAWPRFFTLTTRYGLLRMSALWQTTVLVGRLTDADRRLMTGFHFATIPSQIAPATLAQSVALLHAHPAIVEELRQLLPVLDEQSTHLTYPLELSQADGLGHLYSAVCACEAHS